MKILGLEHRANNILGYQKKDGEFVAILKAPKGKIELVEILYDDPYNWKKVTDSWENSRWHCEKRQTFLKKESDEIFDYYKFEINSIEKRFKYFFTFKYKNKKWSYGEFGLIEFKELDKFNYHSFAFTWNYSSIGKYFGAPKWWNEMSWYQIFPDRFSSSKNKQMDFIDKNEDNTPSGGDLKGIISKLNYIKNLGFKGIYLNPIFKAMSAHKYDTINYKKIDEDFGTIEDFRKLVKELKKSDMKIMLDGVFNHIGSDHPIWLDVVEKKQKSKYSNWFLVRDWENLKNANEYKDDEFQKNKAYSTFANTQYMPRINWANKEASDFILDIIEFWINEGINAWRMDVADEVSFEMWRRVRSKVKSINPEIVLLGEIWYDAQIFLNGDQFDSSMNYPFRTNVLDLFKDTEMNLKDFTNQYVENKYRYSEEINKGLFNLVSSHDTPRISAMVNQDIIKTRLAIAILLISPGVISFYYGDEIDLDYNSPILNRGIFYWDFDKNNITYNMTKELLKFRNDNIKSIVNGVTLKQENNNKLIFNFDFETKITFDLTNLKIHIKNKGKEILFNLKGKK